MSKHTDSTDSKIRRRIQGQKRGWVFTPERFSDLGTRRAVDIALMRQRDSGLIRQLARGLYDYPKIDPRLGPLQPSTDAIAGALAGRDAAPAATLRGLRRQFARALHAGSHATRLFDGWPLTHCPGRQAPDHPEAHDPPAIWPPRARSADW